MGTKLASDASGGTNFSPVKHAAEKKDSKEPNDEGQRQWDTIKKTLERRKDEGRVDAANWHELPCSVATSRSGSCVAMLEASIHLTTPNLPRSPGIIPRMYPDIFFIIVCGLDDTLMTL